MEGLLLGSICYLLCIQPNPVFICYKILDGWSSCNQILSVIYEVLGHVHCELNVDNHFLQCLEINK